MASPCLEPPDPTVLAPASNSMRARLYALLGGGALTLLAELRECPHAPRGDGVELQAEEAPAAAAMARARAGTCSLLLVVLGEEHVLHASRLSFAEGPSPAEKEGSNKDGEEAESADEKGGAGQQGEEERDNGESDKQQELRPVQKEDHVEQHEFSLKLRIWPRSLRLHLILFDKQSWLLTRQYSICCLSNDETELLTRETKEELQEDETIFSSLLRSDFEGVMVPSPDVSLFVESKLSPSIYDFQINQFLGKGATCNVHLGNYRHDHNDYAIKVMKLKKEIQDEPREVAIQSCLRSAYVVRFSQAWIGSLCNLKDEECSDSCSSGSSSPRKRRSANISEFCYMSSAQTEGSSAGACSFSVSSESFGEWKSDKIHSDSGPLKSLVHCEGGSEEVQYAECLCISMEFCPRTLGGYLSLESHTLDVGKSRFIFLEMTKGLNQLHDAGIVHRDIKPSNIFFDLIGGIKIADFGHSCFHPDCATSFEGTPNRGTPFYAAPELTTGLNTSEKVDIYSLGVIYLQLFHSFRTACDVCKTFSRYRKDGGSPVEWEGDLALFRQMTSEDPVERPSAADILDYITKGPS